MKSAQNVKLEITISNPYKGTIGHKLKTVLTVGSTLPIDDSEVIYSDWIPSGSFVDVSVFVDDSIIYSERKLIPNSPGWHEGSDLLAEVIGTQVLKHECDVWTACRISEDGEGRIKCHIGIPGEHGHKAKFRSEVSVQTQG